MNMKNLLQALNDIEPPKVEDKKRLIQEGAGPGQILNVQMEELDSASLRYLSGVRKTIEECGMAPMSTSMAPPVPRPPATLNITAADAHELGSLLRTMTGLNGDDGYKHEPVYRADPSPVYHDNNDEFGDMKGMVKLIDDGEIEEEIIQDGMKDDVPIYDNSPDRETHGGNWPLDGDMDNNNAAYGNVIVDRNKMDIAEQLMAEYKKFVAEAKKEKPGKKKFRQALTKGLVHDAAYNPEHIEELKNRIEKLKRILSLGRGSDIVRGNMERHLKRLEDELKLYTPEKTEETIVRRHTNEAWNVKTKVSPKEKGKYKGKTAGELRKQLNSLKKSGPHKKGSKEYGEIRELQFAIRAKTGWGKVSNSKKKSK